MSLEYASLMPALDEMLRRMIERIPSIEASDQSRVDLGLYLDGVPREEDFLSSGLAVTTPRSLSRITSAR